MQNASMHAAKIFYKTWKIHTYILNVFAAASKVCSRCRGNYIKRKNSRTSIDSITTTSELLMFVISSTLFR